MTKKCWPPDHWNHRADTDYYSQLAKLFNLMSSEQPQILFDNTARAMGDAPEEIKMRATLGIVSKQSQHTVKE